MDYQNILSNEFRELDLIAKKQKEKYIDELFSLLDKQAFLIHKATLEKHHNRELRFDEVVVLEDKINDYISDDDSQANYIITYCC